MKRSLNNQAGFNPIEVVLGVAILILVVITAWMAYDRRPSATPPVPTPKITAPHIVVTSSPSPSVSPSSSPSTSPSPTASPVPLD